MDRPRDDLGGCFWAIAAIAAAIVIVAASSHYQDKYERQRIRDEVQKVLDERMVATKKSGE